MIIRTSTSGRKATTVKPCLGIGKVSIRKPQVVAIQATTESKPQACTASAWVSDFQARKANQNPRLEWEGLWK